MLSLHFKFVNVYFGMQRSSAFCSVRNSCVPEVRANGRLFALVGGERGINDLCRTLTAGSPKMQLLGVYDEYLVQPLAQVLMNLGVKRGMVVYGQDRLDEISLSAPTTVCEFKDGWMKNYVIKPEDFGMERCTKADLVGGLPEENAKITRDILAGAQGPKRNAVLLNAGASLYIGGKAESFADGVKLAAELIDSGKALQTLEKLIELSNK